jgi:hypothetical protein
VESEPQKREYQRWSRLTIQRHKLSEYWRMMAVAYDPAQFPVTRNGLALLDAIVHRRGTAFGAGGLGAGAFAAGAFAVSAFAALAFGGPHGTGPDADSRGALDTC